MNESLGCISSSKHSSSSILNNISYNKVNMIKDLLPLVALVLITPLLIIHILFMRSCTEEADSILSWDKALEDNEILRAMVRRLYRQRNEANYTQLLALAICLLLLLERVLQWSTITTCPIITIPRE